MISPESKSSIITEICQLIGISSPPKFILNMDWVELDSGIWLVSPEQISYLESIKDHDLLKSLKYAGIFIGKVRKNFGLSVESLQFLQPYIKRFVIIKGKTLQKYLYGKTITITVNEKDLNDLDLKKIIVSTPEGIPVGISKFTILETRKENNETIHNIKLDPITDLGMFLRKERTMFE